MAAYAPLLANLSQVTGHSRDRSLQWATNMTDSAGKYLLANVSIGTYTLSFMLDGFKKTVRANVVITPKLEWRVDQELEQSVLPPTDAPTRPVVFTKKTVTNSGTNTVPPPHPCSAPR